jgi:outer membrane immunogenic protein
MKAMFGSAALVALLAVGSAVGTGPAVAADMPLKAAPAPAYYNWSGIYFGGTGGVGRLNTNWDFFNAGNSPFPNPTDDVNWVGGGFVGIQWQAGNWVFGAEGNWIATGLETSATCPNTAFHCLVKMNDYWTAGVRVGYVMWNALWYATGGYAEGRLESRGQSIATGVSVEVTKVTHPGWYIGAGSEFALGNTGLIFGVEYTHVQLDTKSHLTIPAIDNRNVSGDIDTFRARLSYKFNWWR